MTQFCSVAYCQVTQVDSGFVISRDYAKFIAAKFDSLDAYKIAHKQAVEAADTCNGLLNYAEKVIKEQDLQYKLQLRQISAQSEMIESYKRSEVVYIDMQKQLKKETRKRKVWKATAVTFISLFGASLIYIAI
jgi:hypothetical protein